MSNFGQRPSVDIASKIQWTNEASNIRHIFVKSSYFLPLFSEKLKTLSFQCLAKTHISLRKRRNLT